MFNGVAKVDRPNVTPRLDICSKDVDDDSRSTWGVGPEYEIDSDTSDFADENFGVRRRRRKGRVSAVKVIGFYILRILWCQCLHHRIVSFVIYVAVSWVRVILCGITGDSRA